MPRITVSVRDAEPNPALVMALRRVTGADVADLAAAVFQGTPLIDEELHEQTDEAQLDRIHQLLALLRVTALQVVIGRDAREIDEESLLHELQVWRGALGRTRMVD